MANFNVQTPSLSLGNLSSPLSVTSPTPSYYAPPKSAGLSISLFSTINDLSVSSINPTKMGRKISAGPSLVLSLSDPGGGGGAIQLPTTGQIWPSGLVRQ